jgi:hypothetical protein
MKQEILLLRFILQATGGSWAVVFLLAAGLYISATINWLIFAKAHVIFN